MSTDHFKLGIDGGGTGCRARLADLDGRVLGEGASGPANLGLGVEAARASVLEATRGALAQAALDEAALPRVHAGLGLAGANVPRHRAAFLQLALPFATTALRSDAEAACLGAHRGGDGGILILGTGSQGVVHVGGRFSTLGGWGFALSDTGSGAVLGHAAVRRSLLAHEGIEPASGFTAAVIAELGGDPASMVEWAARARPREWGQFARVAFEHAARHDAVALQLVQHSARDVERLLDKLAAMGAPRIALMGGVAQPTVPYLSAHHRARLVPPAGDAMDGALLLCKLQAA